MLNSGVHVGPFGVQASRRLSALPVAPLLGLPSWRVRLWSPSFLDAPSVRGCHRALRWLGPSVSVRLWLGQRSHSRGRLGLTVGRLVGEAGVWGDEAGGDRVGAEIGDGCMSPWVRRTGMIAAVVTDGCLPVTHPSVDSWSVSAST